MSNQPNLPDDESQEKEPYVPASTPKRIIAWTGVVYMVIIVLLTLIPFFRGGEYLRGVGPLLVCPGTAGLLSICLWQVRQPDCPKGKKAGMLALAAASAAIFLLGFADGLPALLAGLGG